MIFVDDGTCFTDSSLEFFERNKKLLKGKIIRLECRRGTPDVIYNTKLWTDQSDEMQLSGFTCGKDHESSRGLMHLINALEWDLSKEQIVWLVTTKDHIIIDFKQKGDKWDFYVDSKD